VTITGPALASPAPAGAVPLSSPARPPQARPSVPDNLEIRGDFGRRRVAADFRPIYQRPGFWAVAGAAVLGLLLLGGRLRWKRRASDEALRRAAALRRKRAHLRRTLTAESTDRAAFYAAACRLAQLEAATPQTPELAGSLAKIYRCHEQLAYSGDDAAPQSLPQEERRAVLATLASLERD
jgi:hypothetical protein